MLKPKSKQRPWGRIRSDKPVLVMANRKRDEFYHTSRWKKESKIFRQEHPLCEECVKEDIIVPSEVTDHKVPKNICEDPWDKNNWEALCKKCHAKKGSRDKKYFKR